jgi:uncharacterized circularly permuted ATP-grasp superfamily protein
MSVIGEAIEYYHELLSKHVASTVTGLNQATEKLRLTVVGRPVCNVLRPLFLDKQTYEMVRNASSTVMQAFRKLSDRLYRDAALRAQLQLIPETEEALKIDTGYGAADVSARLDGFLGSDGSFHFVEYNADSPGGIGFGDALADAFLSFPILKEFSKTFHVETIPVRQRTLEALMSAYQRWGGKGKPSIAIVDWHNSPTFNEFLLMQEHFNRNGYSSVIADPGDLEFRNGTLYAASQPVQFVYKRVVVGELFQKFGLNHPLIEAVKARAVCMANGLAVQMLFNKMLFAFLSDPAYEVVEPKTRATIDRHIPWTRIVREGRTTHFGKDADLLSYISEHRERFVLKPVSEYGGKGVVLGWECTSEQWANTIQAALKSSYVVQERVPVGIEIYPSYIDGSISMDERFFDLDPYVWNGIDVDGCGVRLSRAALLNVSAGGGSATPMMIVSR